MQNKTGTTNVPAPTKGVRGPTGPSGNAQPQPEPVKSQNKPISNWLEQQKTYPGPGIN